MKRLSDSHLADLETKIAMNNKIKGFLIKMPVGGGRLDPSLIGRRRRSDPSSRLFMDKLLEQQSDEEHIPSEDYSDFLYNYIH
ncbi:unnamed protein product [Acanthoscelides obtectus]|uniref:Uncharacterized protein n=1 Tax=Acanthoscelides obtectus TaxID=200917 RepID=A0A9P0KF57_ACAOB|nr:unnamed protein product [Acanthoscelides obtectus]CAK1677192.1 hypothetical protein AOBTE_LOCUS31175 [Acanthoscelides obtectus]